MPDGARVLFVSPTNNLYGASRSMVDLLRGLPDFGITPSVALARKGPLGPLLRAEGFEVVPFKTKTWFTTRREPWRMVRQAVIDHYYAARLARYARESGIGLVHTNTLNSMVGGLVALKTGLPHIWHMREQVDTEEGRRFLYGTRYAARFIDRSSTLVICHSRFMMEGTARYCRPEKLRLVYSGVLDPNDLDREPPPRRPFDRSTGVDLLFVGKIQPRKGHADAIRALAVLRDRGVPARLVVAGEGRSYNEEPLQKLADELGVADRIEWLGFVKNGRELYSRGDVTVLCSRLEPIPRVLMESLADGCPAIATRSGGNPEVLEHERTGLLYEPGDVEGLAEQVTLLVDDPAMREELTRCGRADVYRRFNFGRYRQEVVSLYREVGFSPA